MTHTHHTQNILNTTPRKVTPLQRRILRVARGNALLGYGALAIVGFFSLYGVMILLLRIAVAIR